MRHALSTKYVLIIVLMPCELWAWYISSHTIGFCFQWDYVLKTSYHCAPTSHWCECWRYVLEPVWQAEHFWWRTGFSGVMPFCLCVFNKNHVKCRERLVRTAFKLLGQRKYWKLTMTRHIMIGASMLKTFAIVANRIQEQKTRNFVKSVQTETRGTGGRALASTVKWPLQPFLYLSLYFI